MADLFVEVFPVAQEVVSPMLAYRLHLMEPLASRQLNRLGNRLASQLRRAYESHWLWADDRLITDDERSTVELMITADLLRESVPAIFAPLMDIQLDLGWQQTPGITAQFVIRSRLRELPLQAALDNLETRILNARTEREPKLRAWTVSEHPAVSISIASRLLYYQNVQQFAGLERDITVLNDKLAGLSVKDKSTGERGEITKVVGMLGDHRQRLIDLLPPDDPMRDILRRAMDGEWVIAAQFGRSTYEFLASTLNLVVRQAQFDRFEVDPKQALLTLQMHPAERAKHVKAVSDIAKDAGVLENAYNARTLPDLFFSADFEMNLRFNDNRVRPYQAEKLPLDFTQCGVYRMRDQRIVRLCIVNTLPYKTDDFIEALSRYIQRHFDFTIEVIRERQVRVISPGNIESAVRVVEKEDPDIILAFFADEISADEDEDSDTDINATYIKSLTLARALPIHLIYQSVMDDPEAMPAIVMNLLGKTGNTPFVLAEPLDYADYVVGLDVVRNTLKTTDETRLTAIARVYKADGEFVRYVVRTLTLQENTLPFVLMRDLFPQRVYAGKRIILHHDGVFAGDLFTALTTWGQAIRATFYPVEVVRTGAPRIYAVDGGVVQPPWGSAFKLSDTEALLVSSLPKDDITPQPLHIRTIAASPAPPLSIERALRGVLVWTLLAYAERLPKLPVTLMNNRQLAYWLEKGGAFNAEEGGVPFWL